MSSVSRGLNAHCQRAGPAPAAGAARALTPPRPVGVSGARGRTAAGPRGKQRRRSGPRGAAAHPCGRGTRSAASRPRSRRGTTRRGATRPAEPSPQRRPRGPRSLTTAEAARRGRAEGCGQRRCGSARPRRYPARPGPARMGRPPRTAPL